MFQWGLDLFNFGYYWESHEAWEAVWQLESRRTPDALFLQTLIKLAAAGVKAREGQANGIARHVARGLELLEQARLGSVYCGVAIAELKETLAWLGRHAAALVDTQAASVKCVLPVRIYPRFAEQDMEQASERQ